MKTHFGSINFTTKERVEFPYIDDIVKGFNKFLKQYCKEYNIPLIAARISINVTNQELPTLENTYTQNDYIKEEEK